MATRTIYFDKCAAISAVNQATHYTPGATHAYEGTLKKSLLIKSTASVDDIKFRKLKSYTFFLHAAEWDNSDTVCDDTVRSLRSAFDENSVTYATAPYSSGAIYVNFYKENVPGYGQSNVYDRDGFVLRNLIQFGAEVPGVLVTISTPNSNYKPYVVIEYTDDDAGLIVSPTYPTTGATISHALDTIFSWSAYSSVGSMGTVGGETISPVETKFRWRYSGESSYNEANTGDNQTYTIPAGTFHSGTIEWQVEVLSNSGVTTTTAWTAVEVKEPVPSSVVVAPKNAVLDAATAIKFEWSHVISNGTPQTKFDLQTSQNNFDWTTIRTESTRDTFTVFDANTFDGGDLYWRVRTYNSDGISGDWSEPAHCIIIAAPNAPIVAITRVAPKFAIRWQQTGQQAYEIMLDGQIILKKYGLETNYEYPSFLEDGVHSVSVRIQNKYSLWSDWGFTDVVVKNTAGNPIRLTASIDQTVTLSWNTDSQYSLYEIYRNGVKIAEAAAGTYTDHFAFDKSTYQVRGVLAEVGSYTLSNPAEVDATSRKMVISAVKDPVWLDISMSASSLRTTGLNVTQSVTYKTYIGAALPSAEIGEHVSKTYTFDAGWPTKDRNSIDAFERLLGKLVCIKTPCGSRIVGILNPINRRENRLITTFSASITLVDWKEMGK